MQVEVFWDVASPYTFLAHTQLPEMARRTGASLWYRPMLLGGVFKAIGHAMPAAVPGKGAYMQRDLARWRDRYGIAFRLPVREVVFPVNSVFAMRVATVLAARGRGFDGADALMRAYWVDGRDVSDRDVVRAVVETLALEADEVVAAAEDADTKSALRATTDEAVERGVFGAPTMFVDGEMFWGNDRLSFVEAALAR